MAAKNSGSRGGDLGRDRNQNIGNRRIAFRHFRKEGPKVLGGICCGENEVGPIGRNSKEAGRRVRELHVAEGRRVVNKVSHT